MNEAMNREQNIQRSSFSAFLVMICTLISRVLGFVRIALISAVFGASGQADVLNTVFTIPNNLRKQIGRGHV